jgi:opacity protein-like surface antigen
MHKLKLFFCSLIFSGITLTLQSNPTIAQEDEKLYFRLQPGVFLINDIGFSQSASGYGVTVTANGNYTFEAGTSLLGAIGLRMTDVLTLEGELGYSQADYENIEGTLTATAGSTSVSSTGSLNVDGQVTMITGLGNLIFSPASKDKFSPYFGAGIGFANIEDKVNSIGTLAVNGKEENTKLLTNLIAGFDFNPGDDVTFGARYRYLWADTGANGVDDATAQSFLATIRWNL